MRKKEIAASLLGRLDARKLPFLAGQKSGALRILAYHRVLDEDLNAFDFDEALVSATSENFARQMKWARNHFNVVSFRDLDECERAGRPWPARALIVTFDDGYRDNYTHAFPILRDLGLPATIFLATGHIGRAQLFWWDLIAWCVKKSPRAAVTFPEIRAAPLLLDTPAHQREAIQICLRWIKSVPEAEKNQFLAELDGKMDVVLPPDVAAQMHLSWEEVGEMADGGIEFGSHTVIHPILANVSQTQLEQEICGSKAALEGHLKRPALVLSYPVGGAAQINEDVQKMVERCGFRYAATYMEDVATAASNRFALPRIHVDYDQSFNLFRANLLFPGLMLR